MDTKNRATSTVTMRPRLSLSTKQIGQRLKSEEGNQLSDYNRQGYGDMQETTENEDVEYAEETEDTEEAEETEESSDDPIIFEGKGRIELTKNDLLRLLAMLEGELQAKDIALAVLRCEQLKRLTRPIQISRASILKRYNKLSEFQKTSNEPKNNEGSSVTSSDQKSESSAKNNEQVIILDDCSINQSKYTDEYANDEFLTYNATLEMIEQNPLLALSKDAVYIYDYDRCDVQSTKNYLNFKIHHLENLIHQHKRYRLYMNDRLGKSERLCFNLTRELEKERKRKIDEERNRFFLAERSSLLHQVERFKNALEEEKSTKQKIVLTLINELLDEREKRGEITRALSLQNQVVEGLKGETERSLIMEAELETIGLELKQQAEQFEREKSDLKEKLALAEARNMELVNQLEQQQLLISSAKSNVSNNDTVRASPVNRATKSGQTSVGGQSAMNFSRGTSVHQVISSGKVSSPTRSISTIQRSPSNATTNNGTSANTSTMVRPAVAPPLTGSRSSSSLASKASSVPGSDNNNVRVQSGSPYVKSPISQSSRSKSMAASSGNNSHQRSVPPPIPANKPQIPAKPAFVTSKRASASNISTVIASSINAPVTLSTATLNLNSTNSHVITSTIVNNLSNSTSNNNNNNNNNNNEKLKPETTDIKSEKFMQNT